MSIEGFEVVGIEEFKEEVRKLREKIKNMMDKVAALEEAARVSEFLAQHGYKLRVVEAEEDLPPIYEVDLGKVLVYIIVYPPRYELLAGEASRPASFILYGPPAERAEGKYIVLIYFTRKGKLGPAAYLYLGMLIEEYNIGILFVNGSEEEIADILDSLKKHGKYEPPEDEALPLG
ncbi:MAG: hypothetical protein LRS46_02105 [Desulfurococcales archaeon]|nr:hypothetical protein [Desulfurococcales archaeon]